MKRITVLIFFLSVFSIHSVSQTAKTINIMTYNIHHGVGIDGKFDLVRIAQLIKDHNIDIAAFQEVDIETERVDGINLLDSLAALTEMKWKFGETLEFQGGEYGNGILTNLPILHFESEKFNMVTENEQRAFMKLQVQVAGDTLVFVNTHFDHKEDDMERKNLAVQLIKELNEVKKPVIICGDLNDIPESKTLEILKKDFIDVWILIKRKEKNTYPADIPKRRIDYILTSIKHTAHGKLRPISIEVLESAASDHLPVIMEVEIN